MVRKYWYACDNVHSSGEEYEKIEHFHTSVILTTYKVFHWEEDEVLYEYEKDSNT